MRRHLLTHLLMASVAAILAVPPALAHESVFYVQGRGGTGSGFLMDGSGLILTSDSLIQGGRYVSVTVGPGKKFGAELLAGDEKLGVAVIRVHPDAIPGLEPLPLAPQDSSASPLQAGMTVQLPGRGEGEGPPREAFVKKLRKRRISFKRGTLLGPLGGPILNDQGQVLGIVVSSSPRALPIHLAEGVLLEARHKSADTQPPSAASLTVASKTVYPEETMQPLISDGMEPGAYHLQAGEIDLEFLTPPLVHYLPETPEGAVYRPGEGFFEWQRYSGMVQPVVVVQAVPEFRLTRAYMARVGGFSMYCIAYPGLVLLAALSGAQDLPPIPSPPRATYRFGPKFREIQLLRNGVEVHPLQTNLVCDKRKVLMVRKPGKTAKLRKVSGCYGAYSYAPEAFAPGEPVEIRVFAGKGKKSTEPQVVQVGELSDRVWADFKPYFEATAQLDTNADSDTP